MALACIISRKLSIVCLPAGRSNFTNENVERSPAKKKKEKKNEELKPNPPIHSIAAERRELELYNRAVGTGECQGGHGDPPPIDYGQKKTKRKLFCFKRPFLILGVPLQIF